MSSARLRNLNPPDLRTVPAREPILRVALKLVTPMIGGGATTGGDGGEGGADPSHPFREASVRGQLRWWWRATVGVKFATVDEMRNAEAELWGGQHSKSERGKHGKVGIRIAKVAGVNFLRPMEGILVDASPREQNRHLADRLRENGIPGYALGPMHTADTMREKRLVAPGASFELEIWPNVPLTDDEKDQVRMAVWYWVTYGGIGGRTRRGFGVMSATGGLPPKPKDLDEPILPISHVRGADLFAYPKGTEDPLEAWGIAIETYREYRRGSWPGHRRPTPNNHHHFGTFTHSPWPEADSLRTRPLDPRFSGPAFPRTQFGLPLSISCQTSHTGAFQPRTLKGATEGRDRLASFVLCRPLMVNRQWRAAIILLRQPALDLGKVGFELPTGGTEPLPPGSTLSAARAPQKFVQCTGGTSFAYVAAPFPASASMRAAFSRYLDRMANWGHMTIR